MNDTSIYAMSPAHQLEIETLRDQRDLYRTLLLSEPAALGAGMTHALGSVEQLRALLRALREIEIRPEITGNDLLPAMVVLGDLCSHITIAADCASVHVPLIEDDQAASELQASRRRAQPKLAAALHQLFDMLGQLLRNAIEHGIEAPEQRALQAKPAQGTLLVEFVDRAAEGFELNMQDDGAGLDAGGIAEIAVRKGLLSADAAEGIDPSKLASLIFQPGMSTAKDAARRGQGMQIVRDHINRLGGRIQAATKTGQSTRFRMHLPALATEEPRIGVRA